MDKLLQALLLRQSEENAKFILDSKKQLHSMTIRQQAEIKRISKTPGSNSDQFDLLTQYENEYAETNSMLFEMWAMIQHRHYIEKFDYRGRMNLEK